jgi:hypothetical protein
VLTKAIDLVDARPAGLQKASDASSSLAQDTNLVWRGGH